MKAIVNRRELQRALRAVRPCMGGPSPDEQEILFVATADSLTLYGHLGTSDAPKKKLAHLHPSSHYLVGAAVVPVLEAEPGVGSVVALEFTRLLVKLDTETVELHPDIQSHLLVVRAGGNDYALQSLGKHATDAPKLEEALATEPTGVVAASLLLDALNFTAPFVGDNVTNPGLCLVQAKDQRLQAGDGKRVAAVRLPSLGDIEFLLEPGPVRAVQALLRRAEGDVSVHQAEGWTYIGNATGWVGVKDTRIPHIVVKATFPDFFATEEEYMFSVDRRAFAAVLSRVIETVDKDVTRIGLLLAHEMLTVTARGESGNRTSEVVPILRTDGHEELTVAVNGRNLRDALAAMTGQSVRICIHHRSPSFFRVVEIIRDHAGREILSRAMFLGLIKRER